MIDQIKKQYYTIGEVAELLSENASLIRYWHSQFEEIQPKKNRKGERIFTEKDIELLKNIHFLLKVKKMTIKGAKDIISGANLKSMEKERQMLEMLIKMRDFLLDLRNSL